MLSTSRHVSASWLKRRKDRQVAGLGEAGHSESEGEWDLELLWVEQKDRQPSVMPSAGWATSRRSRTRPRMRHERRHTRLSGRRGHAVRTGGGVGVGMRREICERVLWGRGSVQKTRRGRARSLWTWKAARRAKPHRTRQTRSGSAAATILQFSEAKAPLHFEPEFRDTAAIASEWEV